MSVFLRGTMAHIPYRQGGWQRHLSCPARHALPNTRDDSLPAWMPNSIYCCGQAVKSLAWQPPPSPVTFLGGRKVTRDNVEAATGQAQLFFSLFFFKYGRSSRKTQKTHRGLISKGGWMPGFEKLLLAFCFLLPFPG